MRCPKCGGTVLSYSGVLGCTGCYQTFTRDELEEILVWEADPITKFRHTRLVARWAFDPSIHEKVAF